MIMFFVSSLFVLMESFTKPDTTIGTNGEKMLLRRPGYSSNPDNTRNENECVSYCYFNHNDYSDRQLFKKLKKAINKYCRDHIIKTEKSFDKNAYYEYKKSLIDKLHKAGYLTPNLRTCTQKLQELEEVKAIEKLLKLKPQAW